MSQEALAEAVGISKSYLSKIERADVKGLSLITLLDIAGALDVQIGDLMKFDERIIHDVRTMRFFYNYDMQRMYIDRHPNDGDWRYLDPKGSWAEIGIAHPAGKIAFRLAYGMDFYGR